MPLPKRRYRSILRAVYAESWAILPSKLEAICELLDLRAAGVVFSRDQIAARLAAAGGRNQEMNRGRIAAPRSGNIAVLPLYGTITQRASLMSEYSGGTSTEAFGRMFDQVVSDDNVAAIVMDIDSPGGTVTGVEELAAKIYAARGRKPIYAIANGLAASAAYWIGTAADKLFVSPSGQVGSIGVLNIHVDDTAAMEQMGLKRTIISSGKYKAEGYEALTESAKSFIQQKSNEIYDKFVGAVAQHRGVKPEAVRKQYGEGRVLLAEQALAAGMVDRVLTFEALIAELSTPPANNPMGARAETQSIPAADPLTTQQITTPSDTEVRTMDPKIYAALVKAGLIAADAAATVAQAALNGFLAARGFVGCKALNAQASDYVATVVAILDQPAATAGSQGLQPLAAVAAPLQLQTATLEATSDDRAGNILAAVRLANLEDPLTFASTLINDPQVSLAAAMRRIQEQASQQRPPSGATVIRPEAAAVDKFRSEARDALLIRTMGGSLPSQIWDRRAGTFVDWKPSAQTHRNYALRSLPRLAERCLAIEGYSSGFISQLAPFQMAQLAMGVLDPHQTGFYASSDGPAYNVSGMFANLLLDASNVMLRRSYQEANTTFQIWMRQGESLPDFKLTNKVIAGELPDPKAIPEDGEFEESTLTDGKESYRLTVWGEVFSITFQAVLADSTDSFTQIPTKQGRAMRRKQNKLAYQTLKDNAALSDTIALFDANSLATPGHNNLTTGANAPSVATLNTMTRKMMEMTGLNVSARTTLNLMPRWMLAAPALRGTVLELLGSTANPASSGNSGIKNIWQNGLEPIIDAELGLAAGGADEAYYLAADNNDVDTVEYAYLMGLEIPAMDQERAFDRLALRQRIYQAFAVKPLDFRGLQKHAGA